MYCNDWLRCEELTRQPSVVRRELLPRSHAIWNNHLLLNTLRRRELHQLTRATSRWHGDHDLPTLRNEGRSHLGLLHRWCHHSRIRLASLPKCLRSLDHVLLLGWKRLEDVRRWPLVGLRLECLFNCIQLDLLLCQHAAAHNSVHAICQMMQVLGGVAVGAHPRAIGQDVDARRDPQKRIIASVIADVESGLHHEAIAHDRHMGAAASLQAHARLAATAGRVAAQAGTTATDIVFSCDVQDLAPLLVSETAWAT